MKNMNKEVIDEFIKKIKFQNIASNIDVIFSPLVLDNSVLKQIKFPKSKKKRIRKKWAKRFSNYGWVDLPTFYRVGDKIYANKLAYDAFKKYFNYEPKKQKMD